MRGRLSEKSPPIPAPPQPIQRNSLSSTQAQSRLSSALSRLLVVVERYPDLKANNSFVTLQAQLEGTENRIAVSRRDFNNAVQSYNTAIKSFPAVFYAAMIGFKEKPYFAASAGAETAPKVQFDFNNNPAPGKALIPVKRLALYLLLPLVVAGMGCRGYSQGASPLFQRLRQRRVVVGRRSTQHET